MESLLGWTQNHWFSLVQSVGILGGLGATFLTLLRDRKARKIGNYLTLASHHRDLWKDVHRQPELARILKADVDLIAQPLSSPEQEFLNLVIVHFHTGWLLAQEKMFLSLDLLAADARAFFNLPLPREVWKLSRHYQDPRFVDFIESSAQLTFPKQV